jgi:hypothetical protein
VDSMLPGSCTIFVLLSVCTVTSNCNFSWPILPFLSPQLAWHGRNTARRNDHYMSRPFASPVSTWWMWDRHQRAIISLVVRRSRPVVMTIVVRKSHSCRSRIAIFGPPSKIISTLAFWSGAVSPCLLEHTPNDWHSGENC